MQVLPEARQVERELNLRALVAASVAVIVAMASFALIFGLVLRDQIYFWYCAHLLNFMIWYSVSSWLLGQSVSLGVDAARWLLIIPTIFSALSTYFVTLFAVNFMALQLHYPRWSRLLQSASFVILMLGLLSVLTLWLPIPRRWLVNAQNLSLGLLTLALLATAIRLAFRGQRYARYFATGWTPLLILVVISVISSLQDAYVAQLLRVALLPAVAFEAFLLSIGLADRTLALKLERDAAMQAAERDSLTGVLNRRGFEGRWAAQAASDQPGALLICDLDHFKRINDQYGHPAGDQCLKRFAERAERVLPPDALLGRFGGEEFLVYLPSADGGEAQRQAERLRAEIAAAPVVVESESICLTVSIGVLIGRPGSRETLAIAIARADAALYRAKSEGRNRVVIAESDARA
jgi:diguanylate cyclase (GGDEF)-like protein